MKKYFKIIDDVKKLGIIYLDDDFAWAKEQGFEEQEVEQGFDENWYLMGYAPKKPLEELKTEKRAEINAARDQAEQGGFEYMGKIFDSDPISCIRIQGAAMSMQAVAMSEQTQTITWTCKDNTTIDLTAQELMELSVSLAQWSNTCHQKATELKKQIEACQTKEELEQIKW